MYEVRFCSSFLPFPSKNASGVPFSTVSGTPELLIYLIIILIILTHWQNYNHRSMHPHMPAQSFPVYTVRQTAPVAAFLRHLLKILPVSLVYPILTAFCKASSTSSTTAAGAHSASTSLNALGAFAASQYFF